MSINSVELSLKVTKYLLIILNIILITTCIKYFLIESNFLGLSRLRIGTHFLSSSLVLSQNLIISLFVVIHVILLLSTVYYCYINLILITIITSFVFILLISVSTVNANLLIIEFIIILITIFYIFLIKNKIHYKRRVNNQTFSVSLFGDQL